MDGEEEKVEELAEKVRQRPYKLLSNDCIIKSIRVKRECRELGIKVKVVACIGISCASWFGKKLMIPVIHGWVEYKGKRIETSRPLGASGIWGIVPVNIKPLISIKF